jgi:hypothetical protein
MAKRKLLQWMRERLISHADKIVIPVAEKKALDAAYRKALPKVLAVVQKKFPPAEMKVLAKWRAVCNCDAAKLQYPTGVVTEFKFHADDKPQRASDYEYRGQMYLVDAATAAAVDAWKSAAELYESERGKRLVAYKALIAGASTVEDLTDVWPEAKGILPAGSPLIPLGPEQIALVKADQRERKAA